MKMNSVVALYSVEGARTAPGRHGPGNSRK
jgi:hypothetical protein